MALMFLIQVLMLLVVERYTLESKYFQPLPTHHIESHWSAHQSMPDKNIHVIVNALPEWYPFDLEDMVLLFLIVALTIVAVVLRIQAHMNFH